MVKKKKHFEIFKKVVYQLEKKTNLLTTSTNENKELLFLCYAMNFNGKRRRNKKYLLNEAS